jgi:hypothetical protein
MNFNPIQPSWLVISLKICNRFFLEEMQFLIAYWINRTHLLKMFPDCQGVFPCSRNFLSNTSFTHIGVL